MVSHKMYNLLETARPNVNITIINKDRTEDFFATICNFKKNRNLQFGEKMQFR